MPSDYTVRLIVVMRPGFAAKANLAAKLVDTVGGEFTFTVPLRLAGDAGNTIRAYWCDWALTPAQAQNLHDRLIAQGLLEDEVRVVPRSEKDTFVFDSAARACIFDARENQGWTPQEVLTALGLDTLSSPLGG